MVSICGIDEAGKGPVIGPLVVCGVKIAEERESELKALGVNDSKLLSPKRREFLFDKILDLVDDHKLVVLGPSDIDAALQDPSTNLLWFEADHIAGIINSLNPDKAFIDCPSNNISAFDDYLRSKLNTDAELVSEHKADKNHPVVAAASIIAKVTRDRAIEELKKKYGNFGSGYPSDPVTRAWLEQNYREYPKIIRKSWQTFKNLIAKKEQKGLSDF